MKNIKETRNYFIKEVDQNGLMSNKHQKFCTTLSYIKCFLILASVVAGCISISAFASLLGIPIGTTSSDIDLKLCAIAAEKCKSIIKKKNKHDNIVLLGKSKFSSIEVLMPRALIVSYISHDEFVLVKNVLKEYVNWKNKSKILITDQHH